MGVTCLFQSKTHAMSDVWIFCTRLSVQLISQETKLRSFHAHVAIAICVGKKTYGNAACNSSVLSILMQISHLFMNKGLSW